MSSINTSNLIRNKQNNNIKSISSKENHNNVSKNSSNFSLKFLHWNPNSIKNKIKEFKHFINIVSPSIISLNETKFNKVSAEKYLNIENYVSLHKHRSEQNGAGGVALLIHNSINFKIIDDLDFLNLELIAIEISIIDICFIVISYYNPPSSTLSHALFSILSSNKKFKNFIILGDLNAKLKFFNETSNQNGELLEEILLENDILLLNNSSITHKSFSGTSESVLD